jgi:hypothetical protein
VDRAQKEEKMEAGLAKLEDTWGRVAFTFAPHKEGSGVSLAKMAEEDFEVGARCVWWGGGAASAYSPVALRATPLPAAPA